MAIILEDLLDLWMKLVERQFSAALLVACLLLTFSRKLEKYFSFPKFDFLFKYILLVCDIIIIIFFFGA